MSLFSQTKVPLGDEQVTAVAVSNVPMNPSLAVTTKSKIMLFNENGEKHDYELSRNISATFIQWHPSQPILAIGWQNGSVTLWQQDVKMPKEETSVHKQAISVISFNPSGSRMVTADVGGTVAVWRGINNICVYKKEGIITHAIFCELNIDSKMKTHNLFFFGGKSGVVSLADDSNHCSDVCQVGGAIQSLVFYDQQNSVIIITSSLLFVQFKISPSQQTGPDKKVKLAIAGNSEKLRSILIGSCVLATCSYENMLRLWHLQEDENYVLTLHDIDCDENQAAQVVSDKITTSKYDRNGKVLVAGTLNGWVLFWQNLAVGSESPNNNDQWKPLPIINLNAVRPSTSTSKRGGTQADDDNKTVHDLSIGRNSGLIAVQLNREVYLVNETVIKGQMSSTIKLLQTSSNKVQIYLQTEINSQMFLFESKENIQGLDCTDQYLLHWSSQQIEVQEIIVNVQQASTQLVGTINERAMRVGMHGDSIIMVNEYEIKVTNHQGVVKQNLTFSESEGKIMNINILQNTLVLWTTNNYIRIFDLSRREYKQVGVTRRFEDSSGPLGNIRSCSINLSGTQIIIVSDTKKNNSFYADSKFFIYDIDMDKFIDFDCGPDNIPIEPFCDRTDERLFGILTNKKITEKKEEKQQDDDQEEKEMGNLELLTFFVTSQTGIKKQDAYHLEKELQGVFAMSVPYIHFIKRNPTNDPTSNYKISDKLYNDFIGLDRIDEATIKGILNFSFFLTSGNLDEAYQSVKSIQNPAVWQKMAQMCVKTKRLDVAEICIGNMRFARGAKAIRESKQQDELEAQLAMVAIQLNMKQEAVQLYEGSNRHDLLNEMMQADGQWDKALEIAEKHDRINLKSTYFKTAKMYEVSQDYENAVIYYEKSDTYRKQVPRMLYANGQIQMLETYIEKKKDKQLYKWWAQYLESQGRYQLAMEFYKAANDYASLVRIKCHSKDFQGAKVICNESNDPTACYILAKQFEMKEIIPEAITYYSKAQYFTQAAKLARERNMDSDALALSHQGPKQVKLQTASYFEEKNFMDKAIDLYMKGGNLKKAMQLAQKFNLREFIDQITNLMAREDHSSSSSGGGGGMGDTESVINDLLQRQPEKALPLLINSKQFERALDICARFNIPITDDLVKKIVPEEPAKNPVDEKKRLELLNLLGETLQKQGNYGMASQMFIRLGDKVKAVKCLINLGDINKVVTFANNARVSEIYILAANFLQTADWHQNGQLVTTIISFYKKAQAYDHLGGFFDACSSLQIDEYRCYQKAVTALNEAVKIFSLSTSEDKDTRIQNIKHKLFYMEQFIEARLLTESNPDKMLETCQDLLERMAVRSGDIYAHMIEFYHSINKMQNAYDCIQQMNAKGIVLTPYVDHQIVQKIYEACGVKNYKHTNAQKNVDQDEPFQEEQVADD